MTFSFLVVQVRRHKKTRRLGAYVMQDSADKKLSGKNMLMNKNVFRIETAKSRVRDKLAKHCSEILFDVTAPPDLVRERKVKTVDAGTEQKA